MGTLLARVLALAILFAATSRAYAHVEINIDLSSQTMIVHSGSGETYVWPISSGRTGHPTPRGVFRPSALRHCPLRQVRQRADAALHLLLWPIRDSRHDGGQKSRPAGVAWLRSDFARERGDVVRHG